MFMPMGDTFDRVYYAVSQKRFSSGRYRTAYENPALWSANSNKDSLRCLFIPTVSFYIPIDLVYYIYIVYIYLTASS